MLPSRYSGSTKWSQESHVPGVLKRQSRAARLGRHSDGGAPTHGASATSNIWTNTPPTSLLSHSSKTMGLSGCSDSVSSASDEYCSSVGELRTQISSLGSLVGGDTTSEQVHEQRDAVEHAYRATVDAAGDLDEAVSSEAQIAYDTFQSSVGDIPDDATLGETATQDASAAQTYLSSLANVAQEAGCSNG